MLAENYRMQRERFIRSLSLTGHSPEREITAGIAAINWQGSVLLFTGDDDVQRDAMREYNIYWLFEIVYSTPKVTSGLMCDCLQTEYFLNDKSGLISFTMRCTVYSFT